MSAEFSPINLVDLGFLVVGFANRVRKMGQEVVVSGAAAAAPTSLAPGFRFHPTDEELVRYYLRRKACAKPFRFQAVTEIDVYKSEPWELAGM